MICTSQGHGLLIQRYFCALYDYAGKADLIEGSWNPKRKLGVTVHCSEIIELRFGKTMPYIDKYVAFSSPEATDRDLWQGPKQEVRKSRTSGFCAQPQKFERITVAISYKNGQLLCLRVTLAPTRGARSVALAKRIAALGTRMSMLML